MKKSAKILYTLFPFTGALFILCLLFTSCKQEIVSEKNQYDYKKDDSLPPDYLCELGNIRVSMEDVAKLNELLLKDNYVYNNGILNATSKSTSYSNSKIQALNLGVYGADLSYAVAFHQAQDARNYIEVVLQLSQKLGVESAFNKDLIDKLTSEDTTINKSILLTRAFRHAEDNMFSHERAHLATLMVAGGYIESLYLAISILKSKPHNIKLNPEIFNNVYTYHNVRKMLKVFERDCKDCNEVLAEFENIRDPINEVIQSKYSITEKQITELYEPLSKLRNKVIDKL